MKRFAVLFCCMGNICRSPTAEGVFRHVVREAGLADRIHIDSAGTHGYHVGSPPDERSKHHASLRGYDLSQLRARQVAAPDFERFDLLLAMDWENLSLLEEACPPEHRHKLRRLMEFAPEGLSDVVADPYYGGKQGFETVLDHIEAASEGLLRHIRREAGI
ncbi:MAG TPA: low molecular weight protein-tyrosine-phosphatase [Ramlibacter sp.]|uniref:low molecular weight protein-tyrosine-phosphatase n=1 Tax=Ramlibacter sp. TaxID=1917967 RepID=UPI002ED14875